MPVPAGCPPVGGPAPPPVTTNCGAAPVVRHATAGAVSATGEVTYTCDYCYTAVTPPLAPPYNPVPPPQVTQLTRTCSGNTWTGTATCVRK